MLTIKVDEAFAFDMLAILELKKHRSDIDEGNYDTLLSNICKQVGVTLAGNILISEAYDNLLKANREVFNYIEQICAGDQLDAITVHNGNMKRYYCKQRLQTEFFGEDLNERKTV
ncbi:MAG: hypothetical protein WCQ50_16100 [Spirochaetota bacterium]